MKVEIIKQVDGGLPVGSIEDFADEIAKMLIEAGRAKSITDQGNQDDQVEPTKQGRKQK